MKHLARSFLKRFEYQYFSFLLCTIHVLVLTAFCCSQKDAYAEVYRKVMKEALLEVT